MNLTAFIQENIIGYNFWGNTVKEYFIALLVFFGVMVLIKIGKKVISSRMKKIADHTHIDFFDLITKILNIIRWPFYIFFSVYVAIQFLSLGEIVNKIVYYLLVFVSAFYLVKIAQEFVGYGFQKIIKKKEAEESGEFDPSIIYLLRTVVNILVWVLAAVLVLQALSYDITTLVAGLGIGGLAVAFALQGILGDVFASFSIYFDQPFKIGDYIVVGNDSGTVKNIGIKSTRIQTLQGEELVVSNKELTSARIHNYKRMERRRIAFKVGILYETTSEKIKKIPALVKEIFDKIEIADLDRVHFKEFADFSLNLEIVYYLNSSDYNQYMDTQQEVNLALKESFEREGIHFAYPTQKIFLDRENEA
jgi:small-conductance mechanosensitive channel